MIAALRHWLDRVFARRLIALSRSRKAVILLALDGGLAPVLLGLTHALFGSFVTSATAASEGAMLLLLAAIGSAALGLSRMRLKRFAETGLGRSALLAGGLGALVIVFESRRSGVWAPALPLFFALFYFVGQVALRHALLRLMAALYQRSQVVSRIAIYGATASGIALARALMDRSGVLTCAFLDDSPALRGAQLNGVPVLPSSAAARLRRDYNIDRVVLADPTLPDPRKRALSQRFEAEGLSMQTLPGFAQLLADQDLAARLEPVRGGDFLGRNALDDTMQVSAEFYRGKTVLVSGAGGSIGRELCRQLLQFAPLRLLLLELSEAALYQAEAELRPLADAAGTALVGVLGSAGDPLLLRELFAREHIEAVIHAAAYKHVPIVEANPRVGLRNNVFATVQLAQAASAAGVARFILISSDKAVAPRSVMGASKRMAELVVQDLATRSARTIFSIVRFGNVIGSSGSVVPLFEEQIQRGGPLTLTDRRATRYFMSIEEAARLVLLTGTWETQGGLHVLDMGAPILMLDLARRMIEARGLRLRDAQCPDGDIEIVTIGLRPGEKLHEEKMTGPEACLTEHPKILRVPQPHLSEIGTAALLRDLHVALNVENPGYLDAVLARVLETAPSPEAGTSQEEAPIAATRSRPTGSRAAVASPRAPMVSQTVVPAIAPAIVLPEARSG